MGGASALCVEITRQSRARSGYPRFDRAFRHPGDDRGRRDIKLERGDQDQRLALRRRQGGNGRFKVPQIVTPRLDRRLGLPQGHGGQATLFDPTPALLIKEEVAQQAERPCAQIGALGPGVPPFKRPQDGVLHQIVGSRDITREEASEGPQLRHESHDGLAVFAILLFHAPLRCTATIHLTIELFQKVPR